MENQHNHDLNFKCIFNIDKFRLKFHNNDLRSDFFFVLTKEKLKTNEVKPSNKNCSEADIVA